MLEKLDPRILPIWEQGQQVEQRLKPKQPFSREKFQESAEKQKQEIAVRISNADNKQKHPQQESDYDLDIPPRIIPPKTIKDNFSMSQHLLEPTKPLGKLTAGTTPHSAAPPGTNQGLPSLYDCAKLLMKRIPLIIFQGNLYGYNGRCYDFLSPADVIRLYREKVDIQLGGEKNMGSISQLHKFLTTDSRLQINEVECNQHIAVLNNGIFDVEAGKLKQHSDKRIAFSYVNADYVETGKCKYFRQFLRAVTHDDEILQERLWQFLGYMLLQTTEGKVFFVMGTAPDSGKSVLSNFIESLFDERYVSNIALNDFNRSFASAPIVGSAINVSLDLPATKLKPSAVSQIKMLTGGDAFSVNQKFVPVFRYRNRAKLLFASNFPIELSEHDDAFWNRLVYLPFDFSIPKADQNSDLINMLQEEKDAIVSEALRHAKILIENNFCFPTTPLIERRMEEWQGRVSPSIENFLSDCCVIGESYRGELVDTLFSTYQQYCNRVGFVAKARPFFKQFLENQVSLRHFKMRDGGDNPQSAFRGIKIKEEN